MDSYKASIDFEFIDPSLLTMNHPQQAMDGMQHIEQNANQTNETACQGLSEAEQWLESTLPPDGSHSWLELMNFENEIQKLKDTAEDQKSRLERLENILKQQDSYIRHLHDWATKTEKLNNDFRNILQTLYNQVNESKMQ
ncbi:hypothetical protein CCHR01_18543 [Colletotrichum chrysophilum]|uniref:Uncharacterized protein n=1 Tax=Colletotrichum chrysophilum TaxID=1836956 RepID=A0AAD9EBD3_9PEZI|nr:hypothetical protein CCHR01_18543 [Colletotrichum chrysophilum]